MSSHSISINELSIDTAYHIARLAVELWPDCDEQEEFSYFSEMINDPDATAWFVSVDGLPVGFAEASVRRDYVEGSEGAPVGYLEGIYVREAFRHLGLARQLVEMAENWARSKGLKQMASDTLQENTLGQQFHENLGFMEAGRIICYIKEL